MVRIILAACVVWCGPLLSAQALCVTVSPNPAPLGAPITVSGHATGATPLYTPNGCWVASIKAGVPNGAGVQGYFCITIPVQIPPCGTTSPRSFTWNQRDFNNAQVPPGLYWFQINHAPSGFSPSTTEWHCVTISAPTPEPVLSCSPTAFWGAPFQLTLGAPTHPSELYGIALSGSTNTGLALGPGLFVCLDVDSIFNMTYPTPDPNFFVGFQGVLDAGGSAVGTIFIPPLFIGCFPLHAQAGVVDASSNITLSNQIAFKIN